MKLQRLQSSAWSGVDIDEDGNPDGHVMLPWEPSS
jgi:hypothetical protein